MPFVTRGREARARGGNCASKPPARASQRCKGTRQGRARTCPWPGPFQLSTWVLLDERSKLVSLAGCSRAARLLDASSYSTCGKLLEQRGWRLAKGGVCYRRLLGAALTASRPRALRDEFRAHIFHVFSCATLSLGPARPAGESGSQPRAPSPSLHVVGQAMRPQPEKRRPNERYRCCDVQTSSAVCPTWPAVHREPFLAQARNEDESARLLPLQPIRSRQTRPGHPALALRDLP
eukprot:366454-Chlamydomonas_euryale.AAC.12